MMLKMCKEVMLAMVFALFGLTISTAEVSAEQAAAQHYRQIFESGNFYVEYETHEFFKWVWGTHNFNQNHILAAKNDKRITTAKKAKHPNVIYQDGKYYRFLTRLKASRDIMIGMPSSKAVTKSIVLPEAKLDSPNLNPDEEWQYIRSDLALPDELAVFYWNDPFRADEIKSSTPYFNGSSTRTVGKKDYDCDQYIVDIKSLAGTTIAQDAYNMLYENGQLVIIQKYFLRDDKETLIREINIKSITDQVPDTAFAIKKKFKVYAADTGTLSDLIEQPALVEEIGGK